MYPEGLDGWRPILGTHQAAVLGKASCEACRLITKTFERKCLTELLGHVRHRIGMVREGAPVRRKGFRVRDDVIVSQHEDHPDAFPAFLVLPLFDTSAGLFTPSNVWRRPVRHHIARVVLEPSRPSTSYTQDELGINITLNAETYQRMIVKIGFCGAVLKYGIDGFNPIVRDFIRGKERALGKYVRGFDLKEEIPAPKGVIHSVMLREQFIRSGVHTGTYILAFVRLFANFGAPTNAVFVGTVKNDTP